jgi:hypothetical protein
MLAEGGMRLIKSYRSAATRFPAISAAGILIKSIGKIFAFVFSCQQTRKLLR